MAGAAEPSRSRRGLLAALVVALVAGALGWAILSRDPHPNSAELGREGYRVVEGVPDDFPPGVVPDDAVEVAGQVLRTGDAWTADVSFVTAGTLERVNDHVEGVLLADGWKVRQRSVDDVSSLVTLQHDDGRLASLSHQVLPDGVGTSIVLRGTLADSR